MYFFVGVADWEPGAMKARRVGAEELRMRFQTAAIRTPCLNSLIDCLLSILAFFVALRGPFAPFVVISSLGRGSSAQHDRRCCKKC